MSCANCKLPIKKFDTEKDYVKFSESLSTLVNSGKYMRLGLDVKNGFVEISYQCQGCSTMWKLSVPDQAFRGGWHEAK